MSLNSAAIRVQFVLSFTFLRAVNTGCSYWGTSEFRLRNLSNCRSYLSFFLRGLLFHNYNHKDLHCWALSKVKTRGIIFFLTQTFIRILMTLGKKETHLHACWKVLLQFFWWSQLPPQGTSGTHLFLLSLSCMVCQYFFAFPDFCTWE